MHFILWTITLLRQGSFDAYMSDHPRLPTFGHWLSHCHFRQKDKKNCINWEATSWGVRARAGAAKICSQLLGRFYLSFQCICKTLVFIRLFSTSKKDLPQWYVVCLYVFHKVTFCFETCFTVFAFVRSYCCVDEAVFFQRILISKSFSTNRALMFLFFMLCIFMSF